MSPSKSREIERSKTIRDSERPPASNHNQSNTPYTGPRCLASASLRPNLVRLSTIYMNTFFCFHSSALVQLFSENLLCRLFSPHSLLTNQSTNGCTHSFFTFFLSFESDCRSA